MCGKCSGSARNSEADLRGYADGTDRSEKQRRCSCNCLIKTLDRIQIASDLNRRGLKLWKDRPWDLQYVTSILKLDEQIKRADEYLRLKQQLML
jgi:hypothetical protein